MTTNTSYKGVAAAVKSLQSCPTLCNPIDGSLPGSPIPGILQAGTLEWAAISFSNAWKWKVKVKSLSHVRLLATPWTAAYQAPRSMGFSRKEYWSGEPLPSPTKVLMHVNSLPFSSALLPPRNFSCYFFFLSYWHTIGLWHFIIFRCTALMLFLKIVCLKESTVQINISWVNEASEGTKIWQYSFLYGFACSKLGREPGFPQFNSPYR